MATVEIKREYSVDTDGTDEVLFSVNIPGSIAPHTGMKFQLEYLSLSQRSKKAPNNPQSDFFLVGSGEKGQPKSFWFASGSQRHFKGQMKARFEWADPAGNSQFAEALFDAGNQVNSSQTVSIKTVPPVEITFYARYDDPWPSERAEVQAMRESRWDPTNATFAATCAVHSTSPIQCEDFDTFAGAIIKCRIGSISRINLLTHSNPGLIALAGRVETTGNSIDVYLGRLTNAEMDPQSAPNIGLEYRQLDMAQMDWLNRDANGRAYRDMIRARLRSDAKLYIYGCHGGAGTGVALLQDIAKTFHVDTYGFAEPIRYDPTFTPAMSTPGLRDRVVSRNRTYYRSITTVASGLRHLDPDALSTRKPGTIAP